MKVKALIAVVALFSLVACSNQPVPAPASDDVSSEYRSYFTIPTRTRNSKTAETLTVWALHGDMDRLPVPLQALRVYDLVHKWDYNIDVELGIPASVLPPDPITGAFSYEDMQQGQQRLITELVAGGGPDVIFLDGCDAQSFAAKGALMDLTELAREAGLYDNLIESLKIDDKLYYIPIKMRAPLLWGDPAHMGDVDGFAGLAQKLYESPPPIWANNDGGQFGAVDAAAGSPDDPIALLADALPSGQRTLAGFPSEYFLWELAGPVYGPWLVQENALDTQLLKEQYLAMKQMLDASEAANVPSMQNRITFIGNFWTLDDASNARYRGYTHLAATGADYVQPALAALARGETQEVHPFPARGAVWQPQYLVAISKNAKNPELARDFIRMMLGDELQVMQYRYILNLPTLGNDLGMSSDPYFLPVTQSAIHQIQNKLFAENLRKEYTWAEQYQEQTGPPPTYKELYTDKGIDMRWMSEAEGLPYDLDALMRQFDTAYLPGDHVANAVLVNFNRYRDGELSLDEAVAACEADVALYLAERQ